MALQHLASNPSQIPCVLLHVISASTYCFSLSGLLAVVPILALPEIGQSTAKRCLGPGKEVHQTQDLTPKRFESDCLEPDFSNLSVVWIPWHWFCRTLYIAYYTYRLVISDSSTNTSALHVQLASMQIGPRTSNRPSCHWAAFAQAVCLRKEHGKSHSVPLGHLAPGRALHPETSWVIDMYHVTFNTCHAKARTKLEGPVSSNS